MAEDYKPPPKGLWIALLVVQPLNVIVSGFVLFKLWGWFVTPALHWPSISYGQACGLGVVISAMVASPSVTRKVMPWYEHLLMGLLLDGAFLLTGAIIHALIT